MRATPFSVLLFLVCIVAVKPFTISYGNGSSFTYNSHSGNYNYKLDLPDQQKEEEGLLDTKDGSYVIRGKFSFTSEGQLHTVYYTSDHDGYRARVVKGELMPTSRPILTASTKGVQQTTTAKYFHPTLRPSTGYAYPKPPVTFAPPTDPVNKHVFGSILGAKHR